MFHEGKFKPVYEKIVHEQIDKMCLRNTNILNYLPRLNTSSIFVVKYQSFTNFSIR